MKQQNLLTRLIDEEDPLTPDQYQSEFLGTIIRDLRARRLELQLTHSEVEHRMGVAQHLVAKWERGLRTPSSFMLWIWCEVLDVDLIVLPKSRRSP